MAKIKTYKFRDGNAYTNNTELIEAIGEASHVRQLSIVVAAKSKQAALETLNAVGFGINVSVIHIVLADSPRVTTWVDEGILTEGTVIASSLLSRTPSENRHRPTITQVSTF